MICDGHGVSHMAVALPGIDYQTHVVKVLLEGSSLSISEEIHPPL
jgi:hypothetical protein